MGNLVSRREFLKFTGGVAAGAAAVPTNAVAAAPAADAGDAVLPYKAKVVGKAGALGVNQAVAFHLPRCIVALRAAEDGHPRNSEASVLTRISSLTARCVPTWGAR